MRLLLIMLIVSFASTATGIECNTEIQEGAGRSALNSVLSCLDQRIDESSAAANQLNTALAPILERITALENSGMKQRVRLASRCLAVDQLQICWGRAALPIPSANRHVRNFYFEFEKAFAVAPHVVTNGINTASNGEAFGVYQWQTTPTTYSGKLNNVETDKPTHEQVTMNFIAIGQAGTW
jgi:hypothetical protein